MGTNEEIKENRCGREGQKKRIVGEEEWREKGRI